jgi:two-component system chemotaxis response regulator CheY
MSKRALTVDDSRTMREMVAFALKGGGFEVIEAEDGRQALERLDNQTVDVVVTDLNMPNMNGLELIRALRARPATQYTPILMLTTEADDAKKQEGRSAGATGWIVKPFLPEKLLAVVEKVCP